MSFGSEREANQLRTQIAMFQMKNPETLTFGTKCTYRQTAEDETGGEHLTNYCTRMGNSALMCYGGDFEIDAYENEKFDSFNISN
jgi:hypothetical protein